MLIKIIAKDNTKVLVIKKIIENRQSEAISSLAKNEKFHETGELAEKKKEKYLYFNHFHFTRFIHPI